MVYVNNEYVRKIDELGRIVVPKELRNNLIKRCEEFVKQSEKEDGKYENGISIKDYKKYVIKKSNWLMINSDFW